MLSTQTEVKLEKDAHAHRHCQKKKVFTKLQTRPMEKTQQLCNNRVGKTGRAALPQSEWTTRRSNLPQPSGNRPVIPSG